MRFLSNAHTHTTYCDGRSTVAETLAQARKLGFVSLGFSGHAHQRFDPRYCMSRAEQAAYLRELRALQARPDLGLRLWVGLERDRLAEPEHQPVDYVVASTHYLDTRLGLRRVAVDGDPEAMRAALERRFRGDGLALAREYYALHGAFLETSRPDIIGHFDLVCMHRERLSLFDEADPAYRRIALDALERAFRGGGTLEVNTGAMARGRMTAPYPAAFLLEAWREMGGAVTLTSDCHQAEKLDYAFPETLQMLMDAGYRTVRRLGAGDALWEELPLEP